MGVAFNRIYNILIEINKIGVSSISFVHTTLLMLTASINVYYNNKVKNKKNCRPEQTNLLHHLLELLLYGRAVRWNDRESLQAHCCYQIPRRARVIRRAFGLQGQPTNGSAGKTTKTMISGRRPLKTRQELYDRPTRHPITGGSHFLLLRSTYTHENTWCLILHLTM